MPHRKECMNQITISGRFYRCHYNKNKIIVIRPINAPNDTRFKRSKLLHHNMMSSTK